MFDETVSMKKINEWFEQYVPMSGKADTVGGEIIRAVSRLGYRWWNDGDHLGVGYGNETCNAAARYLLKRCDDTVADAVCAAWGVYSDEKYDDALNKVEDAVVEFLTNFPEFFEMENTENMWDYQEWDDTHYEDEEDEEDEYEEEWEEDEEEC